jgi:hypothetical protein
MVAPVPPACQGQNSKEEVMPFDLAKREVKPVDLQCGVVGAGEVRDCERHRFLSVSVFHCSQEPTCRGVARGCLFVGFS